MDGWMPVRSNQEGAARRSDHNQPDNQTADIATIHASIGRGRQQVIGCMQAALLSHLTQTDRQYLRYFTLPIQTNPLSRPSSHPSPLPFPSPPPLPSLYYRYGLVRYDTIYRMQSYILTAMHTYKSTYEQSTTAHAQRTGRTSQSDRQTVCE